MAKIIQCPTCGENVEIPPGAAGQIIKCLSCGTGIKLVSRKAQAGGASAAEGGAYGSSMMSRPVGRQEEDYGPPSLGECAVCGAMLADPTQLIEDRGRLVCPRCAAESKIQPRETVNTFRPRSADAAAAAPIGFREPEQIVVRHGPFITVNLAFLGGCLALAVFIGASVWLMNHPEPKGTLIPDQKPAPVMSLPPLQPKQDNFEQEKKAEILRAIAEAQALAQRGQPADLQAAEDRYRDVQDLVGRRTLTDPELAAAFATAQSEYGRISDLLKRSNLPPTTQEPTSPAETPSQVAMNVPPPAPDVHAPAAPEPSQPPAPAPDEANASTEPAAGEGPTSRPGGIFTDELDDPSPSGPIAQLNKGMQALAQENYEEALDAFTAAARPFERARGPGGPYKPEHLFALEGEAAACIGLHLYMKAQTPINRVYHNTPRTRSIVINRGIINLVLDQERPRSFDDVQTLLQTQPDEQAVQLFAAMLQTWGPEFTPDSRAIAENVYETAVKQLEGQHPGQRLWGATWIPEESWDDYKAHDFSCKNLEQQVAPLTAKLHNAEADLKNAMNSGRNGVEQQKAVDDLKKQLDDLQSSIQTLRQKYPARDVVTAFRPAMPDPPETLKVTE